MSKRQICLVEQQTQPWAASSASEYGCEDATTAEDDFGLIRGLIVAGAITALAAILVAFAFFWWQVA